MSRSFVGIEENLVLRSVLSVVSGKRPDLGLGVGMENLRNSGARSLDYDAEVVGVVEVDAVLVDVGAVSDVVEGAAVTVDEDDGAGVVQED